VLFEELPDYSRKFKELYFTQREEFHTESTESTEMPDGGKTSLTADNRESTEITEMPDGGKTRLTTDNRESTEMPDGGEGYRLDE